MRLAEPAARPDAIAVVDANNRVDSNTLRSRWRWLSWVIGLLLLNAFVTFHNVWPTLGIRWPGELSVELAALVVILSLSNAWFGPTPRRLLAFLAIVFVLFAIGRYGEVTAPALYGREVNLYWDLPNVASVAGMLTRVAPAGLVAAVALGLLAALALLYVGARWSLNHVDLALRTRKMRFGFGIAGAVLVGLFAVQRISDAVPRVPQFSIPVSDTYAVQIKRVIDTMSISHAAKSLPQSPPMHSALTALAGSDVLVVFMESYGRITFDRPGLASALVKSRERLAAAIHDTHRGVVSAFATSPTFGGGSWLAHLSFLTGLEVDSPDRYALLMTQKRETLVSLFKNAGYRAVAVMPGLRQSWPEGAFYGFDDIYDAKKLRYQGPEFGWWRIPDQFSLAALDSREVQPRPRAPLFAFFPTITTHMPFRPTPPLQDDWARVLSQHPYDAEPTRLALAQTPEWLNMGTSYASSVAYFTDTLASYLRDRPTEKFVLIVLGDHQPAANVSGEGASWDVPVHVITSNTAVLDSLRTHGFADGLTPAPQAAGHLSALPPLLLAAFN